MENVPQLEKHHVFEDFVEALRDEDYKVSWSLVDCTHYGIPQTRMRLVLFASKLGDIGIIDRTHSPGQVRTVRQTIGKLSRIKAGQVCPQDPLHVARTLSELNKKRIASTPLGGSWKHWDEELILNCHKAETGKTYGSIYGRMRWDEPAPTMTTHCCGLGNGRFGHPSQNRAISLREAALFQTFPKYYDFIDPNARFSNKTLCRQIGNAVPVRLGKVIARSIKRHLEEYND
jgi:DNA (cytosine-5)-methyltransferase 1